LLKEDPSFLFFIISQFFFLTTSRSFLPRKGEAWRSVSCIVIQSVSRSHSYSISERAVLSICYSQSAPVLPTPISDLPTTTILGGRPTPITLVTYAGKESGRCHHTSLGLHPIQIRSQVKSTPNLICSRVASIAPVNSAATSGNWVDPERIRGIKRWRLQGLKRTFLGKSVNFG
jgi:hypothetical protein